MSLKLWYYGVIMTTKNTNEPVVLLILDGWGISQYEEGNAVALAHKPNFDHYLNSYPNSQLDACGLNVGLVDGEKGNSEAGHLNIGAGRIVEQDKIKISHLIEENDPNNEFYSNPAFVSAFDHVKKNNSNLHLFGLLSDSQSAHVEQAQLFALLKLIHDKKIDQVYLHLFTDGRDAPQHSAGKFLSQLRQSMFPEQKIASISGRFYAMDRNKRWDRTEKAYKLLVDGVGMAQANSAEEAIMQAYNRGETDEFIKPTVILENNKPVKTVCDNDAVIFFNLRSDRARQLTKAFVQKDFCSKNPTCFIRQQEFENLLFVAMTDFGPDLENIKTAFETAPLVNTLPFVLKDKKQLYISETEKYAHVTFFVNGGYSSAVAGEDRILIPSPAVDSYDKKPEMSTYEITQEVVKHIRLGYDFILVNFACPDMIGHTGNLQAGIKAVEASDICLKKIADEVLNLNGVLLITADHGNVEEMINLKTKEIDTEHSLNKVPFIVVSEKYKNRAVKNGILADLAPTILAIIDLNKPKEMTGNSLIV